jgi:hypothetical protein
MGMFERLGREVGQFTADAKAAAEEYAEEYTEEENYRCADCGTRFAERPAACLECASGAIKPLDEAS